MAKTDLMALAKIGKIKKMAFPSFRTPMLATLTKNFFDDPQWIYERKLDGMRCLIYKNGKMVELSSRNGNKINNSFPILTRQISDFMVNDFVVDGEIVAFEGKRTSFKKLQNRMQVKNPKKILQDGIKAHLYIFDILYFDGYNLESLPLLQRKQLLKKNIPWDGLIRK